MESLQKAVTKALAARQQNRAASQSAGPLDDQCPPESLESGLETSSQTAPHAPEFSSRKKLWPLKPKKNLSLRQTPEKLEAKREQISLEPESPPPAKTLPQTADKNSGETLSEKSEQVEVPEHPDSPAEAAKPSSLDAFELLLRSSPNRSADVTGERRDKPLRPTPNPFGSQRRKNSAVKEGGDLNESPSDGKAPDQRRSLRGWFTPERDKSAKPQTIEPPPESDGRR